MSAKLKLPGDIYTKQQLIEFDEILAQLEVRLRAGEIQAKSGLAVPAGSTEGLASVYINAIDRLTSGELSMEKIKNLRRDLADFMKHCQYAHLVFAHLPPDEELQKMALWFRKEINPQLMFEISINPAIIGGVYLRANSRIYDFTFRKALESNKGKLSQVISSV